MNKKAVASEKEKPGERINQFIVECMFNKYFEEEKEIASPCGEACNDERIEIASSPRSSQ